MTINSCQSADFTPQPLHTNRMTNFAKVRPVATYPDIKVRELKTKYSRTITSKFV